MTGAIGLSFFNSFPTPLSSPLEGLKSGDPTALIPGLKQHCADHIPLYLALLNKPALKRDVKACERFAEALLDHPQFDLGKMQHGEIVQLFSHALTHLSVPVVEHLSENLEDFETVIISHQNSESQSPIVTCLQGYLEHRKLPYCANPRPILRILFELDREMNEQLADAEEIEMKIRVLREEMSNRQYSFDSAVMNVIDEYLTFDSDQSDIEGSDETGSAVCLAGDSDNDV